MAGPHRLQMEGYLGRDVVLRSSLDLCLIRFYPKDAEVGVAN